jgi:hypothetical protein
MRRHARGRHDATHGEGTYPLEALGDLVDGGLERGGLGRGGLGQHLEIADERAH